MKKIIPYLFICAAILACNQQGENKVQPVALPAQPTEMLVVNEDWDGNIVLNIATQQDSADVTQFNILSHYKGLPVGFKLALRHPADSPEFVENGLTFIAQGDTSNNFINALADIYKVQHTNLVFAERTAVTYADLATMTDTTKKGNWIAAQRKMFFTSHDDNPELYLDIDRKTNTILLSEKDSSYRAGIIEALSKH